MTEQLHSRWVRSSVVYTAIVLAFGVAVCEGQAPSRSVYAAVSDDHGSPVHGLTAIDFSIQVGSEAGTEESRRNIRTWMKNVTEFIHSFDFIHAKPAPGWIAAPAAPLVTAALANPGTDYIAYLADVRELVDATAGQPITGSLAFDLPAGTYRACFYSPTAGVYSPGVRVTGGGSLTLEIPPFEHDVVLRVTREP